MTLSMLGSLLGGIGLFILGMRLMTDGFKYAAGHALRDILARSTRTPLRGILSGALITAMVQASAMVTVATIGFVNAGLMSLRQALTLVYGTNIGTTMTGWLVAAVGIDFNIQALALPAIGVGMFLRVFRGERRAGRLGEALAGFGLFFSGLDVLKNAFGALGQSLEFTAIAGSGPLALAAFVGAGFLLTVLLQSSSAALAIILTSAAGGVVEVPNAAAMVIGANVGTTLTALLVVLGATANAKRVAAAHIAFNLITGVVALVLLPVILALLAGGQNLLDVGVGPATQLAMFHTIFNVLGVLLLWPLTGLLVRFLNTRFVRGEKDEAQPQYLDRTLVATPILALQALTRELARLGTMVRGMAREAISSEKVAAHHLEEERATADRLIEAIGEFSNRMQQSNLPPALAEVLPNGLRVSRYHSEMSELAVLIGQAQHRLGDLGHGELAADIGAFKSRVVRLLTDLDRPAAETPDAEAMKELQEAYQSLKSRLLRAGAEGRVPVRRLVEELDNLSNIRRLAEQADKAARYLRSLHAYMEEEKPAAEADGEEKTPVQEP
ncbi:Na/Pi cotransporter family protein [Geoalkalibacter halelectricus]|uniref:Na/Pi cotransporter family protein n=1 Tax=Geoalkalibacter halelectricus TaxID=2847045 RepID=UPI003D1A922C